MATVCCEDFETPWANSPARVSNRPIPLLQDWKLEMRTSATATEKVFLTQLTKQTGKDSESGKE